jgi:plastocyanin
MKSYIIVLIIALILLIGALSIYGIGYINQKINKPSSNDNNSNSGDLNQDSAKGETKTFKITGENFKFKINGADNPDMIVNYGDKVIIEFSSVGGFHDWVVNEFNAKTKRVNNGETTTIEFIADKKGTFEYYCSVGTHRQMGMKGKLIVK